MRPEGLQGLSWPWKSLLLGLAEGKLLAGAKQAREKGVIVEEIGGKYTTGAKARVDYIGFIPGINPRPTTRMGFSAACKARAFFSAIFGTIETLPFESDAQLDSLLSL